jgi:hypothetical protein
MMNWQTLPIALCYLGLAGLVIWFVLSVKAHWLSKLGIAVLVPAAAFMVWRAVGSYQGYPTPEEPPGRALMLWGAVREPNSKTGDPGAIYLWLLPLERKLSGRLEYDPHRTEPRAYRLAYTRRRHEATEAAKGRIREGRPVLFDREGREGEGDEHEITGGREGDGTGMNGHPADGEDDMRFYDLPPPQPPQKNDH